MKKSEKCTLPYHHPESINQGLRIKFINPPQRNIGKGMKIGRTWKNYTQRHPLGLSHSIDNRHSDSGFSSGT
jgi:hypothetical protein